MELKKYGAILRRWLWLILLSTAIAAGTSYFATRQMPRVYQASTTLMVGQSLQNPNPTTELLTVSQQLAQTYAQLVTTDPVLQGALDELALQTSPDRLRDQVNARTIPGTALIEIRVVDTDSLRAQAIANELAHQLILTSPNSDDESNPRRQFVHMQLDEIQRNIEQTQPKMKELESSIKQTKNSIDIEGKQREIDALRYQIGIWQQTYGEFLNYLAPRATNYISVVDPARVSARPIAPNVPLYVFSSAAVGLLLALGGIFIIEYV